jgi:hypothetical protein
MHEVRSSKKVVSTKKRRKLHHVINGEMIRKYRRVSKVSQKTGFSRKSLSNINGKTFNDIKEKRKSLSKQIEDKVVDFFNREDNSRTQPGKADAKRTERGTEQTKVLTDYLKNLHDKFSAENHNIQVSLTTFSRLRPKNILLTSFISRNTCQCLHHQNMALKVKAMRKAGVRISENPENLIHHPELDEICSDALPDPFTYSVWKKVDIGNGKMKMKVVEETKPLSVFTTEMQKQVNDFAQHVSRVREQYQQVRLLKDNLKQNEMIVQMDFTENFSCRSLEEVQSAYWNQSMVTLHPIVAYHKHEGDLKHTSFVVVSDEMSHSASSVCAFLDEIIPKLKEIVPSLEKIHYWTDSPSSQYRNKFIFHSLLMHKTAYGVEARWNYFEAGHGKGPCDGLGGTTKRLADQAIKQGKVVIQDANDFYNWASQSSKGIKFVYVSQDTTKAKQAEFSGLVLKPVKGTMKLHAVGVDASQNTTRLMTRSTSCYCNVCNQGSFCDTWDKHQMEYIQAAEVEPNEASTSRLNDVEEPVEVENVSASTGSTDVREPEVNYELGDFVAAIYEKKWYIGQIEEKDTKDNDVLINFMTSAKNNFKWPAKPDRLWLDVSDILCKIAKPTSCGKSNRTFKISESDRVMLMSSIDG